MSTGQVPQGPPAASLCPTVPGLNARGAERHLSWKAAAFGRRTDVVECQCWAAAPLRTATGKLECVAVACVAWPPACCGRWDARHGMGGQDGMGRTQHSCCRALQSHGPMGERGNARRVRAWAREGCVECPANPLVERSPALKRSAVGVLAAGWPAQRGAMQLVSSASCPDVRGGGAAAEDVALPSLQPTQLPDLLQAVLLSVLGDSCSVACLLQQPWVAEWQGWEEVTQAKTDADVVHLGQRLLRVLEDNAGVAVVSNEVRLERLRLVGWHLWQGRTHGANNCLLDSLLLGLASVGVLPGELLGDVDRRALACAACRQEFVHGPEENLRPRSRNTHGPGRVDCSAYLELDRHAAPAAEFLYKHIVGRAWPAELRVDVVVYTRFDSVDLNPEAWPLRLGKRQGAPSAVVRLYNHMDDRGNGYHFDALLARSRESMQMCRSSSSQAKESAPRGADEVRDLARHPPNVTAPRVPSAEQVHACLEAFLRQRGATGICARASDAERMVAAWNEQDALAEILRTLLQAGLSYSDMTRAASDRLPAQFRGFMLAFCAGRGQQLGRAQTVGVSARHAPGPAATRRNARVKKNEACTNSAGSKSGQRPRGKAAKRQAAAGARGRTLDASSGGNARVTRVGKKRRHSRKRVLPQTEAKEDIAAVAGNSHVSCGATECKAGDARRQKKARSIRKDGVEQTAGQETGDCAGAPQAKRRRYSGKQAPRPEDRATQAAQEEPEEEEEEEEEDQFVLRLKPAACTKDPRARVDEAAAAVVRSLTRHVTLPTDSQRCARSQAASELPNAHCAFAACTWTGTDEAALRHHLHAAHADDLRALTTALADSRGLAQLRAETRDAAREPDTVADAYRYALNVSCQGKAPLACTSLDRRCLRQASDMLAQSPPETRVCMLCAQRFAFVAGSNADIRFSQLLQPNERGQVRFCGQAAETVARLLGRETYVSQYVDDADRVRRECMLRDLQHWQCKLAFPEGSVEIVCCPEDKQCRAGCLQDTACAECWMPVCRHCRKQMQEQTLPKEALANDLVVYYAPRELYEERVTMLELVCASPCMTSLICFSLEKKYRDCRALDERVHMQRHRQGARGNATTFLLDWENLLEQFRAYEKDVGAEGAVVLPRAGNDLQKFVSVLLKTKDEEVDPASLTQLIHQARVRRRVVVLLIENACKRVHPAFGGVDLAAVRLRAEELLPDDGVPPEVVAVLRSTDTDAQVEKQKVAAPVAAPGTVEEAGQEMSLRRPNAVVLEKSVLDATDYEAQRIAAVQALAEVPEEDLQDQGSEQDEGPAPEQDVIASNQAIDQFAPWYFGVAFAYLFQYCTAMPDPPTWGTYKDRRWRRGADAPRVPLHDWVRLMSRRVESQLTRDWTFGYTTWNVLFRSAVNLSRSVYAYDTPVLQDNGKWQKLTSSALEDAACEILRALHGTYTTADKRQVPVNGSMTLVKYASGLSATARRILANLSHAARAVPGTQEARRSMRFEIQGMRVRYGTPIFVTVTPDEGHQLLYIRLARHRQSDPIRLAESQIGQRAGDRQWPGVDEDRDIDLPVECFEMRHPNWEERRRILARDPLATVDGFRVMMLLVMRHLFGLNVCLNCPACNCQGSPCQDADGSSATMAGGVFGRCDAAYLAIEFQKSAGSPHGHIQLFVQCLHQHESLRDIFTLVEERAAELREEYLRYNAHVRRCVYGRDPDAVQAALHEAETRWPEYKTEKHLVRRPQYQNARMVAGCEEEEAAQWANAYLTEDVFRLQVLKQHHVHLPDPATGDRTPQSGCLKAENPRECKHGYPKSAEVTAEAAVLCPCRLKAMELPVSGRRNAICTLHGPRDHAYLNGTHPAILAFTRSNSDVQLPYRLPYTCAICACPLDAGQLRLVIASAQRAQDSQTGYCCDYCAKTQPMAFAELKELRKGHERLAAQTQARGVEYQGKRHMTRFMSDAYCKGIVRGQAECTNLRSRFQEGDATCAESIATTQFVTFPGQEYVRYAELGVTGSTERARRISATALGRSAHVPRQRQVAEKDHAEFYARRPRNAACWYLSPYEFQLRWEVVPTRAPRTWQEWTSSQSPRAWDVTLTSAGEAKLQASGAKGTRLIPGKDTRLRGDLPEYCVAFEDWPANAHVRAAWLLRRRRRPRCPTFGHCPIPRYNQDCAEENSKVCMVYFRAWTGLPKQADEEVPHVADLRGAQPTWEAAFREWLQALPCQEAKHHVSNFLSVYRVRAGAGDAENSDNDDADTSGTYVDAASFRATLQTRSADATSRDEREAEYADLERTWQRRDIDKANGAAAPGIALPSEEQLDVRDILRDARRKETTQKGSSDRFASHEAATRPRDSTATIEAVREWLVKVQKRVDGESRPLCNAAQHAFLSRIVERIVHELQTGEMQCGARADEEDPLRWVLHGGPGTGKTHAVKLLRKELFEEILGWQHGIHFQAAALQAVTADMLDGDTLHHCFGLTWGSGAMDQASLTKGLQLAQRLLQMRWLIIDEISMVSLELLARVERACRQLMRQGSPFKHLPGTLGQRPFGGLNVVAVGDLWQLEPPKGHFVAGLPHEWLCTAAAKQRMLLTQGQDLIWGNAELAFQGVTELTECERTKDLWLQDVQEEFRYSQLSPNTHAFLHGLPTTVPGSWLRGEPRCETTACAALVQRRAAPQRILTDECEVCRKERASRELVARDASDPRFLGRFVGAPSVFATNVRKCHTNKLRAEAYAARTGRELHYVVAQDRASAAVLREKPSLAQEKLTWLQRHDRECGDLCGMLPLCEGLPVFLSDHVNRDRKLLKGRRGYVCSWQHATDGAVRVDPTCVVWNQLPKVVYVKFPEAQWQIPGLALGVYPVTPQRRTWFLDAGRKQPCLAVTRTQLPLLPAFAMTAHQAQGQTIEEGVIADLRYKAISGAMTAYIAMTRVKSRADLLILRPFDAELFQQGDGSFRSLLLQHWRRHDVDWEGIVQQYVRTRTCCECRTERPKMALRRGSGNEPTPPFARSASERTGRAARRIVAAAVRDGRLRKRFLHNP